MQIAKERTTKPTEQSEWELSTLLVSLVGN